MYALSLLLACAGNIKNVSSTNSVDTADTGDITTTIDTSSKDWSPHAPDLEIKGDEPHMPEFDWAFGASIKVTDINGDGANDLVVGSPGWSGNGVFMAGAVMLFIGPIDSDQISPDDAIVITQNTTIDGEMGWPVFVGDVTCDGITDIVTGGITYGEDWNGMVGVIPGGSWIDEIAPGSVIDIADVGSVTEGNAGNTIVVEGLADIDRDGCMDVLPTPGDSGTIALRGGELDSWDINTPSWTFIDSLRIDFWFAIPTTGDINGDSEDDLLLLQHNRAVGNVFAATEGIEPGIVEINDLDVLGTDIAVSGLFDPRNGFFAADTDGDGSDEAYVSSVTNAEGCDGSETQTVALWSSTSEEPVFMVDPCFSSDEESAVPQIGNGVSTFFAVDTNNDGTDELLLSTAMLENSEDGTLQGGALFSLVNGDAEVVLHTPLSTAAEADGENTGFDGLTFGDVDNDGSLDLVAGQRFYDNAAYDESGAIGYVHAWLNWGE